jgi:hypothetical protein
VGDEIFDSINPMQTIRKALRKENRELIELARCKPTTEETRERMRILMQDIEQYGVSTIFKNIISDIY